MGHDKNEGPKRVAPMYVTNAAELIADLTVTTTKGETIMENQTNETNPTDELKAALDVAKGIAEKKADYPFEFTDPETKKKVLACTKTQAWHEIGLPNKETLNMWVDKGRLTHLGYSCREGTNQPIAIYSWESVVAAKESYHPRGEEFGHRYIIKIEPSVFEKALDRLHELLPEDVEEEHDRNVELMDLFEALANAKDETQKGIDKRKVVKK